MMKKAILLFICSLGMGSSLWSSDPLDVLIEGNKTESLIVNDDDLPPIFLTGDKTGVRIYSPFYESDQPNLLCEGLELDELVEMSRGRLEDLETKINLDLPRVKESFERSCLVRPGDMIWCLGHGQQKQLIIKNFVVKRESTFCPTQSPFSLWGEFEEKIDEDPILFSSDGNIKVDENHYRPASDLTVSPADSHLQEKWRGILLFPEEYKITTYLIAAPNCEKIIHCQRLAVSAQDEYLPNELLFWEKDKKIEKLHEERVHSQFGSGHIRLKGIWDFNGDGFTDLLIEGDHKKCPFIEIMQGETDGFVPMGIPNKSCGC